MADRYIFPVVFYPPEKEGFDYCVVFPDLEVATQGATVGEALDMAKELLELTLYGLEEDGLPIPKPSEPADIMPDGPGAFISLISVYMPAVRAEIAHQFVRKTVTIPKWLNDIAESAHINFSRELRNTLTEKLGVGGPPANVSRATSINEQSASYGKRKPKSRGKKAGK